MTSAEVRAFKIDLLDMVEAQSYDPIPDIEAIRDRVEEFFNKLEAEIGEAKRATPGV